MGLRSWWKARQENSDRLRANLAMNTDQVAIGQYVPELLGMDEVEGMAYVLQQIDRWNETCTQEQAATFAGRLLASQESWKADGLTMPYWISLAVLRNLQEEVAGRPGFL